MIFDEVVNKITKILTLILISIKYTYNNKISVY